MRSESQRPLDAITSDVVSAATSGDAAALDRILRALSGPFYNLALRMLQNHQDAEDATQECLIRVTTKLSTFRAESRFSTWAWTVASRAVLDYRNGLARRPGIGAEAFSLDLADGLDLTARADSPEDRVLASRVKLGCGRAMLQVLDGDHRLAYVMVDILELDQAEAAEAVGVAPATFRKRLSRARARMREVLHRNCGIVAPRNPCRCAGRVRRADQLGRLDAKDAAEIDLIQLQARIHALDEMAADAAYYRADPMATPSERVLPRLRNLFGD
ncbi:MAG: RNA polymerase sigma factor [Longimicrobiales bacterium]